MFFVYLVYFVLLFKLFKLFLILVLVMPLPGHCLLLPLEVNRNRRTHKKRMTHAVIGQKCTGGRHFKNTITHDV